MTNSVSENPKEYENPQLLITPEELAMRLKTSIHKESVLKSTNDLVVLDLRPAELYAVGHIPCAVHLDLFGLSLIDTDTAPLEAFCWMIAHLLESRGVKQDRTVVVYDDKSGIRAARAFWFLEFLGHSDSRLLDGGIASWKRKGFLTTTETSAPVRGLFHLERRVESLATWRDVKVRLGKPDAVVLDTRSIEEHNGDVRRAKRAGSIPGSIHLEWTKNLDEAGEFKAASELLALYERLGIDKGKEVISFCQGGYRAAHSYLALRLIGYPKVRNYIGSWKEWGDREDLPINVSTKTAGQNR